MGRLIPWLELPGRLVDVLDPLVEGLDLGFLVGDPPIRGIATRDELCALGGIAIRRGLERTEIPSQVGHDALGGKLDLLGQ